MWARHKIGFVLVLVLASISSFAMPSNVAATDISWLSPGISAQETAPEDTPLNPQVNITHQCTRQEVGIYNRFTLKVDKVEACVHSAKTFRLARVTACVPTPYSSCTAQSWLAISFSTDQYMYRVENLDPGVADSCWRTSPDTDRVVVMCSGYFATIDNIYDYISRKQTIAETFYQFDGSGMKPLYDDARRFVQIYSARTSADNKWAIVEARNLGLLRVNLEDRSMKLFTKDVGLHGYGRDPEYSFAFTDGGEYVATAGGNLPARMYKLDDTCGDDSATFKASWRQSDTTIKECPYLDMAPILRDANGGEAAGFRSFERLNFNYDGGQLTGYYKPGAVSETAKVGWFTLTAEGYVPSPHLEYLALGDSYSSGEGDTQRGRDGKKYYREFTDVAGNKSLEIPREMCHISTRSYPYLLASYMGLGGPREQNNTLWQTVACSGAVAQVDYSINDTYKGQDTRLGLSPSLKSLQDESYSNYIPGRVSQYKFVSRDLPKTVTLTAGGNDVGFGPIITKCAEPGTCDYAKTAAQLRTLAYTMQAQREKLKDLYKDIHRLSPATKIYVLGYPQFITGEKQCNVLNLNVQLNSTEQEFVRQAVSYMNDIIEAAADDAGVMYVDIENSLANHALCGDGKIYVSGINRNCIPLLKWSSSDNCEESFHPNHWGHEAIADAVLASTGDLRSYEYCTDSTVSCPNSRTPAITIPPLFKEALDTEASINSIKSKYQYASLVNDDIVQKGEQDQLDLAYEGLEPSSSASISLASDPVDLGILKLDAKGILTGSVSIPGGVPAGSHTLYVDAKTYSGESIRLWQIVTVLGNDSDQDEDGIDDSEDKCLFVTSYGIDADADGVDDGCDTYIDEIVADINNDDDEATDYTAPAVSVDQEDKQSSDRITLTDVSNAAVVLNNSDYEEYIEPTQLDNNGEVKGVYTANEPDNNAPQILAFIAGLLIIFASSGLVLYTKRRRKKA